jgi:hypothetical protein
MKKKCLICKKVVKEPYTYKDDFGMVFKTLCWECYNRRMNSDMVRAEEDEDRNNHSHNYEQEAKSQEEYEYYRDNRWC